MTNTLLQARLAPALPGPQPQPSAGAGAADLLRAGSPGAAGAEPQPAGRDAAGAVRGRPRAQVIYWRFFSL